MSEIIICKTPRSKFDYKWDDGVNEASSFDLALEEMRSISSKEYYELNNSAFHQGPTFCVKCDGYLFEYEKRNKICTACSIKAYESAGTL